MDRTLHARCAPLADEHVLDAAFFIAHVAGEVGPGNLCRGPETAKDL